MKLKHGGDWAGFESEYGKAPLDFSANVSPLGLPEGVRAAAIRALETADRYPDPLCRKLRAALSKYHGVPVDRIVCGTLRHNDRGDDIHSQSAACQAGQGHKAKIIPL